ncbi:MAG: SLBB domain-containing protein [Bacteroidaceae bacterium]|nr:SLBB domain-containing protein [Bacteroidaceae bacterium]
MRRLFLLVFLLCLGQLAIAQSMTDDKVLEYVQSEQEKGTKQVTIVQNLLQKGVTREQMQRVRKKYEASQSGLGATNGKQTSNPSENRLRTNKEKNEDEWRKRNGYLVKSRRELNEKRLKTREDRTRELTEEMGFLDLDSLLYYQNLLNQQDRNQVFGRNLFNNELLTFEPGMNIATPANYVLGAGDAVIIDVWGATQESFEGIVSPDGVVVIEGVGPIKLAGLNVSKATERVRQTLSQFYQDCEISLSLGDNRSIQVQVMGEVRIPGTYTLSGFSTTFNALYCAGGINDIGTLRNIKVYRSGHLVGTLDVYDYLLNGNARGDIRLQDNDVIMVDTYDALVNVTGKVKRPMFYEMRSNESVSQVIKNAGGFTGDAFTKNIRLTRKAGTEYSMHTVDEFQMSNFTLMDGDSIYVDSVIARFNNMVEVRGAVMHSGQYQLGGDIQTVKGLLLACEGLREDAFRTRAVMHRQKDDLSLEMVSINLEDLLSGATPDVPLRNGDVLFVPSTMDLKGERTLSITGEVMYPGIYQYAENTRVEDLILMAGGLTPAASYARVDVFRRIDNPSATEKSNEVTRQFSISLKEGLQSGESDISLEPYDQVVVRKAPDYAEQKVVTVQGCVNFEGDYAMTDNNFRLSDLIKNAGGITKEAYSRGGRLIRKLTESEKMQQESAMRATQIQMYEEAMQNDKTFNTAQIDSIMDLKLNLSDEYPVAINLEKALNDPGCAEDVVLREGDVLYVPQFNNTVKVSGEVAYSNSMNFIKGKSLGYYIDRAGGYSSKAKQKGVYAIYQNGAVKRLNRRSASKIEPGCEIIVPTKQQSKRISSTEMMAIVSGAASLASIIVALLGVFK